jgi:hypothetical protein
MQTLDCDQRVSARLVAPAGIIAIAYGGMSAGLLQLGMEAYSCGVQHQYWGVQPGDRDGAPGFTKTGKVAQAQNALISAMLGVSRFESLAVAM